MNLNDQHNSYFGESGFGWVKYCWMTFILPTLSQAFSCQNFSIILLQNERLRKGHN